MKITIPGSGPKKGEPLVVSFSGGRTSGFMSREIKARYGDTNPLHFVFANTGQELEQTLEFVDACDRAYGLGVTWVEAVVDPAHGNGIRHKVVSFETAARAGEPFESFISKSGIPNMNKPQCSDRLKALVIEDYKKSAGLKGCLHAIGIRIDEAQRKSESAADKYNVCYPLCDWFPSSRDDVNAFWWKQPFDLEIEAHEGNCQTCWKKSDNKLFLLALEHPGRFDFMDQMEEKYRNVKPNDDGSRRTFFRKGRTAKDIINEAQEFTPEELRRMIGAEPSPAEKCAESCEGYLF